MTETIHLPYLEPWDWQQFHRHFSLRLLPGVERLDLRGYARTLRLGDARGWLGVSAAHDRPALELTL
ncbi:DNA-3-methyladenine glycosylase 2 family protein, partial [Stutzerimonas stutzeri]